MATFKPYPLAPDYLVSDEGEVIGKRGNKLKPVVLDRGYLKVSVRKDGGLRSVAIHRMVAEAFIGPIPEGMHTCHNNGIKTDNRLSNLRYDTPAGNKQDSFKHGTVARGSRNGTHTRPETRLFGEKNQKAKLTSEQVAEIKMRLKNYYLGIGNDLAKEFNISVSAISYIKLGQRWQQVAPKAEKNGITLEQQA